MPDQSPAQTLTAAATKLRENAANALHISPLPWTTDQGGPYGAGVVLAGNDAIVADRSCDEPEDAIDLPWIALMHPGVGAALVSWLLQAARAHRAAESAARRVWREDGDDHSRAEFIAARTDQHALAVARQLLGETG